jgi:hypothetical protein
MTINDDPEDFLLALIAALAMIVALAILLFAYAVEAQERADTRVRPYYIYKDARGVVTIANRLPEKGDSPQRSAQEGGQSPIEILKRYDWPEATDAEIARTERENSAIAARNFEREKLAAAERLATEVARLNAEARGSVSDIPQVTEISIVNEARRWAPQHRIGSRFRSPSIHPSGYSGKRSDR